MRTIDREADRALSRLAVQGIQVRRVSDDGRTLDARVCTYGQLDTYGTVFMPGCFDRTLAEKLPALALHHETTKVIGRAVEVLRNDKVALDLRFRIDSPESVPEAAQAIEQLRNGTLGEFSVGFFPVDPRLSDAEQQKDWERRTRERADGTVEFRDIHELFEVSLVLVGSVPDTGVLAHRSATSRVGEGSVGSNTNSPARSVEDLAADIGEVILEALDQFQNTSVTSKRGTRFVRLSDAETMIVRLGEVLDRHAPLQADDGAEDDAALTDEMRAWHEARSQVSVDAEVDAALARVPHKGYTEKRVDDGDLIDEIDAALAKLPGGK